MTIGTRHKFLGRVKSLDVVTEPEEVPTKNSNNFQSPMETWNKAKIATMDYAKLRVILKEHKNKGHPGEKILQHLLTEIGIHADLLEMQQATNACEACNAVRGRRHQQGNSGSSDGQVQRIPPSRIDKGEVGRIQFQG